MNYRFAPDGDALNVLFHYCQEQRFVEEEAFTQLRDMAKKLAHMIADIIESPGRALWADIPGFMDEVKRAGLL